MGVGYVRGLVQDWLFFSGDVQTTAIALAITSSLGFSIVLLLQSLARGDHGPLLTIFLHIFRGREPGLDPSRKDPRVVCGSPHHACHHVMRRQGSQGKLLYRSNSKVYRSVLPTAASDNSECHMPCIKCGIKSAECLCHSVLCGLCCQIMRPHSCDNHPRHGSVVTSLISGGHQMLLGPSTPSAMSLTSSPVNHPVKTLPCNHGDTADKPTEINLSYLSLRSCPDRVGFMGPQLTVLNLSNNKLRRLPQEISCLLGLQQLRLEFNCLKSLPDSIGSLSRLTELNLRNNRLHELPESVGQLHRLHSLQLTYNRLRALPASLGRLGKLQELLAPCNKLQRLPDSIGTLRSLKRLYVGENPIAQLPDSVGQLVRLEELGLFHCKLACLPESLTWCTSLRRLMVSNNRLSYLPGQIGRLHQLTELYAGMNLLRYLPASIACLHLCVLSLNCNPFLVEREASRCCRVAPTVMPSAPLPPLLELAARTIAKHNVKWRDQGLPWDLHLMLSRGRICSCCEGPLFDYYQSQLSFCTLVGQPGIPLYQQICSPHLPFVCQLRPMVPQT